MENNDSILIDLRDTLGSMQDILEHYIYLMEKVVDNIRSEMEGSPEVIQKMRIYEEYRKIFLSIGYRFTSDTPYFRGEPDIEIERMNDKIRMLYTLLKIGKKV